MPHPGKEAAPEPHVHPKEAPQSPVHQKSKVKEKQGRENTRGGEVVKATEKSDLRTPQAGKKPMTQEQSLPDEGQTKTTGQPEKTQQQWTEQNIESSPKQEEVFNEPKELVQQESRSEDLFPDPPSTDEELFPDPPASRETKARRKRNGKINNKATLAPQRAQGQKRHESMHSRGKANEN